MCTMVFCLCVCCLRVLSRHVKGPGIGLLGTSKGGELGFAMASFLKGIKAAVIINGSVAAVGNTIYYKDETIPPVSLLRNRFKMTKDGVLDVVDGLQSPLVEVKSFNQESSAHLNLSYFPGYHLV
ncbi:acyl-coenzyme A thioesterase 1-like [Meriones unguiculatus]|uniref:acyl-coenzyme A thioesterase 1-like n=1 Tax=Meriones unguiculatus TaxID=10047 RepID=UPI00293EA011|nr:acyl-coenzyme A thioesterase 1-like [Meriones unguiculatus]